MRQHNQIGDMLCSLTLYKALKKKYPDARVTLVAAKTNYEIPFFDINPYLDRVIIFNKSSLKTILIFIKELRSRKYQIGIVPSTIVLSRTSHIINLISGAKIRVGVKSIDGNENKSHKYLNVKSDFIWKDSHQTKRSLDIAKQLGSDLSLEEINSIKIDFNDSDLDFANNFISTNFPDKNKKAIAFHPGAGKEINIWDKKYFIELIKKLTSSFDINILITSGWTDEKIVTEISKELNLTNIKHKILHNASVKKLGAVLSMIDLYITNDTGTMHIAGYSGVKMISLFGPTRPNEWAPKGKNQKYIKATDNNINSIGVDEVFKLAKTFLSENKN
ncbi:MAG: glycosyltransferase family 9 protein [Ignavibacteriales bacterium]|nr:glycosyltransferase family 9 protein [Ignavibacteriales bacterium]